MKYLCGPLPLSWSVSCTILISGHYQRLWGSMCSKSFRQVQRVEQWRRLSRLLKMMMSNPSEVRKSFCYTILMLPSLFFHIYCVLGIWLESLPGLEIVKICVAQYHPILVVFVWNVCIYSGLLSASLGLDCLHHVIASSIPHNVSWDGAGEAGRWCLNTWE